MRCAQGTGVTARSEACQPGEPDPCFRYYARQPILGAQGTLYAYELLFRRGPEENFFRGNLEQATNTTLDNAVLYGLERMTGGALAFINCTAEALTGQLVEVLPPNLTVLEILETVDPTPELIAACHRLKAHGFRLALDDFNWKPGIDPLIKIANYIKIDFKQFNSAERRAVTERFRDRHVKLIAEKVETSEEFEQARKEGFTLFQGYYFCRPVLIENRDIPPNRLTQLRLLQQLHAPEFDVRKIAALVQQDAAITYRLLRLVNSPIYMLRSDISSVRDALFLVGETAFRRVATLAIASSLNVGQPAEILRMALIRARFCELAASRAGLRPDEQLLLGLFSLLPAMLRMPMDVAIADLALPVGIQRALVGEQIPERELLRWIEASEQGDWPLCHQIQTSQSIDEEVLGRCSFEAVEWAEANLRLIH